MVMYKCLTEDLKSWYDMKTTWTPEKWMPTIKNESGSDECGTGYHLGKTINDAMKYGKMPCVIWEAGGRKLYGRGSNKRRYGTARITKDVTPEYILRANAFVATIGNVRWFENHRPPLKSWTLWNTRDAASAAAYDAAHAAASDAAYNAASDAASAAAYNAAYDAASDAAYDAAYNAASDAAYDVASNAASAAAYNAAYDAAHDAASDAAYNAASAAAYDAASDAAYTSTRDAASDAVLNVASDVAYDAASDAAYDAALMARIITCDGLGLSRSHILHAKRRWAVWTRGYGLLCDINGALYVYEKP